MTYLDLAGFRGLSLMAGESIDELETIAPGWVDAQLEAASRHIDARLAKRYAAPFASPYPVAITDWLARVVTVRAMMRRGVDANDEQFLALKEDAAAAWAEIKEAADSNEGLYELPLREDTTASGVSKGGPYGYSEQSPYVWTDKQAATARDEDSAGDGTYG